MKDTYIYPAVFDYADDGISISFPDLPRLSSLCRYRGGSGKKRKGSYDAAPFRNGGG